MVKFEFDQSITFKVADVKDRRGKVAKFQEGSQEWTVVAQDADGDPVDVALEVAEDGMSATLTSQDVEATGVVTFRADGDTDEDEEAPYKATQSFVIDASNAVTATLEAGEPVDVDEEAPVEETPAEEEVAEEPVAEDNGIV